MTQSTHTVHNPADSGSESHSAMTKYDKSDARPIISRVAQAMLGKFGALASGEKRGGGGGL